MTDKSKHANSSIMQGYCPVCKNRSLTYPKNPEYGGLVCRHQGCDWKNVYYIGKSIPKSKMRGSSSSRTKCDKCGQIVKGRRRKLNQHKREHHSY
jgi:uncharacterized protein YbaR (Trm112 family)